MNWTNWVNWVNWVNWMNWVIFIDPKHILLGGVYIFKFDCSSLVPPNIFGRTHLEMFCPKDHIRFMKIGFPSGHIKNQAHAITRVKIQNCRNIAMLPIKTCARRALSQWKKNQVNRANRFWEKSQKPLKRTGSWKPVLSGGFLDFSQKWFARLT